MQIEFFRGFFSRSKTLGALLSREINDLHLSNRVMTDAKDNRYFLSEQSESKIRKVLNGLAYDNLDLLSFHRSIDLDINP